MVLHQQFLHIRQDRRQARRGSKMIIYAGRHHLVSGNLINK